MEAASLVQEGRLKPEIQNAFEALSEQTKGRFVIRVSASADATLISELEKLNTHIIQTDSPSELTTQIDRLGLNGKNISMVMTANGSRLSFAKELYADLNRQVVVSFVDTQSALGAGLIGLSTLAPTLAQQNNAKALIVDVKPNSPFIQQFQAELPFIAYHVFERVWDYLKSVFAGARLTAISA